MIANGQSNSSATNGQKLTFQYGRVRFEYDAEHRVLIGNGGGVYLTNKEATMLDILAEHRGTNVTKEMFLNNLYPGIHEPQPKIIDVFMCHVRGKIDKASGVDGVGMKVIEASYGRGHRLLTDEQLSTKASRLEVTGRRSIGTEFPGRAPVFVRGANSGPAM